MIDTIPILHLPKSCIKMTKGKNYKTWTITLWPNLCIFFSSLSLSVPIMIVAIEWFLERQNKINQTPSLIYQRIARFSSCFHPLLPFCMNCKITASQGGRSHHVLCNLVSPHVLPSFLISIFICFFYFFWELICSVMSILGSIFFVKPWHKSLTPQIIVVEITYKPALLLWKVALERANINLKEE